MPEVYSCLNDLHTKKLRQNEAHGLLLRVNIFLSAYYKYRTIAVEQSLHANFVQDDKQIAEALLNFQEKIPSLQRYSKVSWALFTITLRKFISNKSEVSLNNPKDGSGSNLSNNRLTVNELETLSKAYDSMLAQVMSDSNNLLTPEIQTYI